MLTKNTEDQLVKINNQIEKIKTDSETLCRLQSQDAREFWRAFKSIIEYDIKANKEKISQLLSSGEDVSLANLKLIQGFITCGEKYIQLVEEADEIIARATANIKELREKATKIKDNIDRQ